MSRYTMVQRFYKEDCLSILSTLPINSLQEILDLDLTDKGEILEFLRTGLKKEYLNFALANALKIIDKLTSRGKPNENQQTSIVNDIIANTDITDEESTNIVFENHEEILAPNPPQGEIHPPNRTQGGIRPRNPLQGENESQISSRNYTDISPSEEILAPNPPQGGIRPRYPLQVRNNPPIPPQDGILPRIPPQEEVPLPISSQEEVRLPISSQDEFQTVLAETQSDEAAETNNNHDEAKVLEFIENNQELDQNKINSELHSSLMVLIRNRGQNKVLFKSNLETILRKRINEFYKNKKSNQYQDDNYKFHNKYIKPLCAYYNLDYNELIKPTDETRNIVMNKFRDKRLRKS